MISTSRLPTCFSLHIHGDIEIFLDLFSDVRGNNLTGTIPDNIGNCTSFEIFLICKFFHSLTDALGSPFYIVRELLVVVFYALGDAKRPFLVSVGATALNAILDWLFISKFYFGARGSMHTSRKLNPLRFHMQCSYFHTSLHMACSIACGRAKWLFVVLSATSEDGDDDDNSVTKT
ncbi:putative lipid II flippase MurJ [Camellia lanceoleosa]|uniref:Lipid II flippase MurJ n=1 Tax=Camellia lanceoleosa TaxID=1840588 RepID=A0ACC0F4Z7_9ERIC|nr:putative lipid II flippase MurJ [Camellia lanceoleosa]